MRLRRHNFGKRLFLMRGKVTQLEWATDNKDLIRIPGLIKELTSLIDELEIEVVHVRKYDLVQLPWYELFKNVGEEIEVARSALKSASSLLSSSLRKVATL